MNSPQPPIPVTAGSLGLTWLPMWPRLESSVYQSDGDSSGQGEECCCAW